MERFYCNVVNIYAAAFLSPSYYVFLQRHKNVSAKNINTFSFLSVSLPKCSIVLVWEFEIRTVTLFAKMTNTALHSRKKRLEQVLGNGS